MEWLCGLTLGAIAVAVVGHFLWLAAASVLKAILGEETRRRAPRPFRYCPACGTDTDPTDLDCPKCRLDLDGRLARELYRVRVAEREVRALREADQLDRATADEVLGELEARARRLQGRPAARPRALPVARRPTAVESRIEAPAEASAPASLLAPADAVEVVSEPPAREALPERAEPAALAPPLPPTATSAGDATDERIGRLPPGVAASEAVAPPSPARREPPPRRRLSSFLEEHNILWGELVGGLLIVGCSIALVVTLRQTLEAIPYFRFLLSLAVTLGLFGAGQYTLHRWKLAGTSRGMLVISLLLAPLTLLLLAEPFTPGADPALGAAVKVAALASFVGVIHRGGRDLIGTEHLPGPIDRRWLLALAVVGAAGTQLLPAQLASAWLPLLCFVAACGATLGGLSWYRSWDQPGRREEPVSDKSGSALLLFVGLAAFALFAAWGLYIVRVPAEALGRLHSLALPLALAAVPAVEAGVLVLRRVTSTALRTVGTATALLGFVGMTSGLALAWPDPLDVLLVAGAAGLYLTRVTFRERLPWVQAGAIPLLALAATVAFQGLAGNWAAPAGAGAAQWLAGRVTSAESGATLAGFALVLAGVAEVLARLGSRQVTGYAIGSLAVGALGLLAVSSHGVERPETAAVTHAACALGLLVANARWKRRSLTLAGLWLWLAGTLWGLWGLAPGRMDVWGFAVAAECVALAAGALFLRGFHGPATALFRRGARDVSFPAYALAVVLAASSLTLRSEWHTATLFALALAPLALARLTGWLPLTWAGSTAALLGLVHLGTYTLDGKPVTLTVEAAILTHATLATLGAVLCRRQARVFGDPLRWSARLSSALAVPILFFPPAGHAFAAAGLAAWLGVVWLAFTLLWRERGGLSAFQAAITLVALLAGFGWVEAQPWWVETRLRLFDPRALHAFGLALGAMAIVWSAVRRTLSPYPTARKLWCDDPLSLDRLTLAAAVCGFVLLASFAVTPAVRAELKPGGVDALLGAPAELAHAFDPAAWWLLAVLTAAVLLSWRLTKLARDTDPHALGLALLLLTGATVWAGTHAVDVAAASAIRWGLAVAFVVGTAAVALRGPIRQAALAAGFPVEPSPWLRVRLLAVLAVAAGVVIIVSANVAEIGLSGLKPGGPDPRSIFAQMGTLPANLVPLALVVFGLGLTAARERSGGYALTGGLVFVATLTAGYALAVVTAGKPIDGTEQTRLLLIAAASASLWALAWLTVEWRIPGGLALASQVGVGFGALGVLCFVVAVRVVATPGDPLSAAFDPLGQAGWAALALASAAGFWQARHAWREGTALVFAFAGVAAGVLLAAAVRGWDEPPRWVSFHWLALTWAATGFGFLLARNRGALANAALAALAGLLTICAVRGGWHDPWRPWLPAALAICAALYLGGIAVARRGGAFALLSGAAVNLAAITLWLAWGPATTPGFLLTNAAGLAAGCVAWTLVRIRREPLRDGRWLEEVWIAVVFAFALLVIGLAPTLGANRGPTGLAWGALGAVAAACAVGLWDRSALFARPGLFATGVLAVFLAVAEADARPVWDAPLAPVALAAYAILIAGVTLGASLRGSVLRMPERGDGWPWLLGAQVFVGAGIVALGLRISLLSPHLEARLVAPAGVALLAVAFAVLTRAVPESPRGAARLLVAGLVALTPAALAWAVPEPSDPHAWLRRTGWLFVALSVTAFGGGALPARLAENWRAAVRAVVGATAAAAFGLLCLNLLQQIPVFDPVTKHTPLSREAAVAMLAAVAALFALALRFALRPASDPLSLPERGRTGYVYLAEVLIVLFFTQVRFNLPELFPRELAAFWTFVVMAIAYAGIGLAELFERNKIAVLAVPLRRTGVLLPLVPLLAFWAKPPALLSEFARDHAPGLGPLLGYLERLPQHFDTYAWLWFLAGGAYGLLALWRRSFGWALLAALATNAAMWSLLAHHEVPFAIHPQAWVIPLALIVLVSEHVNRRRLKPEASSAMRYAGVAMIYVASAADMFIAGVGNSTWLPVVLALLCVLGVLGGILLRVRAFIYLGVGFLLLDLFSMIWYAAVDLQQTWVWYASGIVLGVVVLALFAYLEKRRGHVRRGEE